MHREPPAPAVIAQAVHDFAEAIMTTHAYQSVVNEPDARDGVSDGH